MVKKKINSHKSRKQKFTRKKKFINKKYKISSSKKFKNSRRRNSKKKTNLKVMKGGGFGFNFIFGNEVEGLPELPELPELPQKIFGYNRFTGEIDEFDGKIISRIGAIANVTAPYDDPSSEEREFLLVGNQLKLGNRDLPTPENMGKTLQDMVTELNAKNLIPFELGSDNISSTTKIPPINYLDAVSQHYIKYGLKYQEDKSTKEYPYIFGIRNIFFIKKAKYEPAFIQKPIGIDLKIRKSWEIKGLDLELTENEEADFKKTEKLYDSFRKEFEMIDSENIKLFVSKIFPYLPDDDDPEKKEVNYVEESQEPEPKQELDPELEPEPEQESEQEFDPEQEQEQELDPEQEHSELDLKTKVEQERDNLIVYLKDKNSILVDTFVEKYFDFIYSDDLEFIKNCMILLINNLYIETKKTETETETDPGAGNQIEQFFDELFPQMTWFNNTNNIFSVGGSARGSARGSAQGPGILSKQVKKKMPEKLGHQGTKAPRAGTTTAAKARKRIKVRSSKLSSLSSRVKNASKSIVVSIGTYYPDVQKPFYKQYTSHRPYYQASDYIYRGINSSEDMMAKFNPRVNKTTISNYCECFTETTDREWWRRNQIYSHCTINKYGSHFVSGSSFFPQTIIFKDEGGIVAVISYARLKEAKQEHESSASIIPDSFNCSYYSQYYRKQTGSMVPGMTRSPITDRSGKRLKDDVDYFDFESIKGALQTKDKLAQNIISDNDARHFGGAEEFSAIVRMKTKLAANNYPKLFERYTSRSCEYLIPAGENSLKHYKPIYSKCTDLKINNSNICVGLIKIIKSVRIDPLRDFLQALFGTITIDRLNIIHDAVSSDGGNDYVTNMRTLVNKLNTKEIPLENILFYYYVIDTNAHNGCFKFLWLGNNSDGTPSIKPLQWQLKPNQEYAVIGNIPYTGYIHRITKVSNFRINYFEIWNS